MNISDITQKHSVIIGSTNSGKSTFAQHLFVNTPYKAIYYDVQEERNPKSNKVVLLKSSFTLDALKKFDRIVVYGKFKHDDRMSEIYNLVNTLFTLGRYYPKRKIWCNLIVDEAHEIARLHDQDNPLNLVATKGIRYGITLTAITQRPASLNNTILTQASNHFFFNINFYETPYFDKYKLPFDEIEEHIRKEYHFAHWDGKQFTKYKPLDLKSNDGYGKQKLKQESTDSENRQENI